MPNYYNPYQQYYPAQPIYTPQQNQPQMNQPQQIQSGGFISVRSELEARNYPVAPGNSVTFKDETAPYVYTKTMGFSQLDRPNFEKYKLVKEEVNESQEIVNDLVKGEDLEDIKSDIERLWSEIDAIKATFEKPTTSAAKRKKDGDD